MEREAHHLNGFSNLNRWHEAMSLRGAVERAYARAHAINTTPTITEESRKVLLDA